MGGDPAARDRDYVGSLARVDRAMPLMAAERRRVSMARSPRHFAERNSRWHNPRR